MKKDVLYTIGVVSVIVSTALTVAQGLNSMSSITNTVIIGYFILQSIYCIEVYQREERLLNLRRADQAITAGQLSMLLSHLTHDSSLNKGAINTDEITYFETRAKLYKAMTDAVIECGNKESYAGYTFSVTSFYPNSLELEDENEFVKEYHETLRGMICKKNGPNVRRIVSVPTKNKFAWVREQLVQYDNNSRFSLRWHQPSSSLQSDSIPLNIQIYGDEYLFIASPRLNNKRIDHSPLKEKHVRIKSQKIVALFSLYYDQVWDVCSKSVLVENGNLNNSAKRKLRMHSWFLPDNV